MSQLSPVTFHGDTIFCVTLNDQPYTPMKPIVENLGLNWQSQAAKLSAHAERWGIAIIAIPTSSGDQEMVCIPVRKLPAFLASINPKKVRPELRTKIELYQAECDDALWDYWMKGRAERPATLTPFTQDDKTTVEDRKPLKSLVSVWSRMTGIPHTDLWPQVRAQFGIFRIDQLRKGQLPAALAWVQAKIDALPPAAQKELPPAKDRYAELEDKFEAARQNLQRVQRELNRELGLLLGIGMGRIPGKVLAELPDMLWPAMERFLSGGADIHESWSINPVRLVKEIHRAFGVRV